MCHTAGPSTPAIPADHPLVEKLQNLENEEKLFAAHDLLDVINGQTIAEFIDERLMELLGCRLIDLNDKDMADRICYAFFKRNEAIRFWRKMSKLPMFEGLLLAFIFNKMRKLLNSLHEPLVGEEYEKMRNEMDEECTDLLQNCYREDDEQTRFALQLNYHRFIHDGECTLHRIQLMEIAYMGKANKFLAHPACQKAIDRRWQPSYRLDQTSFWLFAYWYFPILFFFHNTEPYAKTTEKFWKRLVMFYASVSSKYVIHMTFRVMYVILYAIALIRMSGKSMVRNNYTDFWEQFAVIGWQCSYLLEMVVIGFQGKFLWWSVRNQVDFYRNVLISVNMVSLILSILISSSRYLLVPITDACFYLSFLLAVIRSMRVLYVDSFFGAIVHMISKMVPIMIKFGLIFLLFWMSFAVCYISLTGHLSHGNHSYSGLPWQMFSHGAFEIFGEANDNDKEGFISGCEDFDLNSSKDSSFHCLFRTWMLPLLLFFYMLISGILLVNILTALLTKEYEDVSKDYHIYWKCMLYARLAEYEEKLWLPAPLSIFAYIIQIPVVMVMAQKRRLQKCCAPSQEDEVPLTFVRQAQPEPDSIFDLTYEKDLPGESNGGGPGGRDHPGSPQGSPGSQDHPRSPPGGLGESAGMGGPKSKQVFSTAVKYARRPSGSHQASDHPETEAPLLPEARPEAISIPLDVPYADEEQPQPNIRPISISAHIGNRRLTGKRPLSIHGITRHEGVVPRFIPQLSKISSKSPSPTSPLQVANDFLDMAHRGVAEVVRMNEEKALGFIQERRDCLVREQNEERSLSAAKQQAMDQILSKFDLTFTRRPRGRTE